MCFVHSYQAECDNNCPATNLTLFERFVNMTWAHLERGSSPVDWCEGNYEVSANIAEFVNTVSCWQPYVLTTCD